MGKLFNYSDKRTSSSARMKPNNIQRTALVTGAAKRLGRAIACGLAADGWDIVVHYHSSEMEALATVDAIKAMGRNAAALACDLSFLSYTLSKSALLTATTMLAQSLAPKLRVVGLAPGLTLVSGDQSEAEFANAHRKTPLGKSSSPDDIVDAVCYLANAKAVTGTVLVVDGGQHLTPLHRDVMFLTQ
jgi:NAD(P)-dependent dehydrogenase (short-subunit alcohol dehydrogenase family)